MKSLLVLACLLLSVEAVLAAPPVAPKKGNSRAQLGTSFKFDGTTLRGKYQTPLGTDATVEDDKYLEDLLGGRVRFTDREQKENVRN